MSVSWTFLARSYGWGATSDYWFKIGDFAPTGVGWPKISCRKGRPPINHSSSQKTRINDLLYGIKNLNRFFFRFVTMHAFVRRTDGQTGRILIARPRLHSMQRGKNANFYACLSVSFHHYCEFGKLQPYARWECLKRFHYYFTYFKSSVYYKFEWETRCPFILDHPIVYSYFRYQPVLDKKLGRVLEQEKVRFAQPYKLLLLGSRFYVLRSEHALVRGSGYLTTDSYNARLVSLRS